MNADSRPNRVRRNLSDLGDILELAGVGDTLDQLLAEALEALFGGGGHGIQNDRSG